MFDKLANYIRANHTGLLATHGTLSDWKIWKDCSGGQKVGTRGHVGDAISDLKILKETTVAGLLGMPLLPVWEVVRDNTAQALCQAGGTASGLALGSTPLQVPFVPFDGAMKATNASREAGWNIPIANIS